MGMHSGKAVAMEACLGRQQCCVVPTGLSSLTWVAWGLLKPVYRYPLGLLALNLLWIGNIVYDVHV